MSVSYITTPIASNPGSPISDTTQIGNLAVGTDPSIDYSQNYGDVQWWMSPDQTNNYIVAFPVPGNNEPVPAGVTPTSASVGFYQSTDLTDATFLNLVNWMSSGSYGSTVSDAQTWLANNGCWTSYGSTTGVTGEWVLYVDSLGYSPAWDSGSITFPNTQGSNDSGLSDPNLILTQGAIYVNEFDSTGTEKGTYLQQAIGNTGQITFRQNSNFITFNFLPDTFEANGASLNHLGIAWDIADATGANDLTLFESSNTSFTGWDGTGTPNSSEFLKIGVALSFTLNPSDITYVGYNAMTPNGTSGFTNNSTNSIGDAYMYYQITSGLTTQVINSYDSLGLSFGISYIFNVTWGAGSTVSTGKVRLLYDGDEIFMSPIDLSHNDWMTNQTYGTDPTNPSLMGTFNFPATFTPYFPVIESNDNYWC